MRVKLRMTIPEGRNRQVVDLPETRALQLIRAGMATALDGPVEPEPAVEPASSPATELPEEGALKAEWEAVADQLNIDLYREDGSKKSKAELIEEVKAATG